MLANFFRQKSRKWRWKKKISMIQQEHFEFCRISLQNCILSVKLIIFRIEFFGNNFAKFQISQIISKWFNRWKLCLPNSLSLSRSLNCRLPGEADIRIFNFCRLNFFTMFLLYHTYFLFPSSFSAFLTSEQNSGIVVRNFINFGKFQLLLKYRRHSDKISSTSEQKSMRRIQN